MAAEAQRPRGAKSRMIRPLVTRTRALEALTTRTRVEPPRKPSERGKRGLGRAAWHKRSLCWQRAPDLMPIRRRLWHHWITIGCSSRPVPLLVEPYLLHAWAPWVPEKLFPESVTMPTCPSCKSWQHVHYSPRNNGWRTFGPRLMLVRAEIAISAQSEAEAVNLGVLDACISRSTHPKRPF